MTPFAFLEDSESDEEGERTAAAEAATPSCSGSSSSHAALVQAAASADIASCAAVVAAPPAAPSPLPVSEMARGGVGELRRRAAERWAQLLTLTSDERLQQALSPAEAEAAAEAEGLSLVRVPGTRSGFKNVSANITNIKRAYPFQAYMAAGKAKIGIGYFVTAEEAALACEWPRDSNRESTHLPPADFLTPTPRPPRARSRRSLDWARAEPQAARIR